MVRSLARLSALIAGGAVAAAAPVAACRRPAPAEAAHAAASSSQPPTLPPQPPQQEPVVRTTDGDIAAHNFLADLAQAERQYQVRPADLDRAGALFDRLLDHAHFFGVLGDYDRAMALAEMAVARDPVSGPARLMRARARAAVHRFPEALSDLDAAEQLAADPERVRQERVAVWQAAGDVDRALPYLRSWRRDRPGLDSYAAEASALADKRDFAGAAAAFGAARRGCTEESPFAVAWVELQEGHLWEAAGRPDRARALYQAAHARLPIYAAAAAHLAGVVAGAGGDAGDRAAAALLEPVVAHSDDPEYAGQLGAIYRRMGRTADGDRLVRGATDRYEALLRDHPAAFYGRAARFFLQVAGDARRAVALAAKNLAMRHTPDAHDLYEQARRAMFAETIAPPR
jgi:tetratricopeptide (TPR) repeat protein